MGRYRSRSRSPVRRSKHYDEPRDRRSPGPSGLLVRNLPLNASNEDLRIPFERYGPLKDIYMPKDYYTGEPRGFGFVKYRYSEDATSAMKHLNHTLIGGREIRIVYAEENRKTPKDMRRITGTSSRSSHRRRSPSRSPRRRRNHSYSRSPSPRREPRNHGRRDAHVSSRRHHSVSRSASPKDDKRYKSVERSSRRHHSVSRSASPKDVKRSVERSSRRHHSNSRSASPKDVKRHKSVEMSSRRHHSVSRSASPKDDKRHKSVERSPRRSRSISKSPPRSKKGDETSHRYSSPGENGHDPHDEDYMPDKSPTQKNSHSRSRSRSITKSPR